MSINAARMTVLLAVLYASTLFLNQTFEKHFVAQTEQDLVQQVFGGFREVIASWAYMKAEEYNHGGMPFLKAMGYHQGEGSLMAERFEHGEEEEHHHGEGGSATDLYSRIYENIKITKHTHLTASQGKELLPWLYLEVKFDPHDIRGYVIGAFCLERLQRSGEALALLKEGLRNNPRSAQVLTALGDFYYSRKAYGDAFRYLSRACPLWAEGRYPNVVTTEYERTDRSLAYDLLGSLYERMHQYDKGESLFKDLYRIDPTPVIREKIKRFQTLSAQSQKITETSGAVVK